MGADDEEEVRVLPEPDICEPYQVVIPWPGLPEAVEAWVKSRGWDLSPRRLFGAEPNELPTRFVQPNEAALRALTKERQTP